MSLSINIATPEGVIIASDSRQTFVNRKGQARVGSDAANKIFKFTDKIGISVVGAAFLPDGKSLKNVSYFIDEFSNKYSEKSQFVKEVAENLNNYFEKIYDWRSQGESFEKNIKTNIENQGGKIISSKNDNGLIVIKYLKNDQENTATALVNPLQFFVFGYDKDGSHKAYVVSVPGKIEKKRDSDEKGLEFGASWIGQTDVVTRIVLGFDPRIGNIPFIQNSINSFGQEKVQKQLQSLEYSIQWGTMTLQDGIEFANLMIETTSAIQKFSDGVLGDPGDIPGVGGPVDIAVITPKKGFVWINKKNLRLGDSEIDLNDIEDSANIKAQNGRKKNSNTNRT